MIDLDALALEYVERRLDNGYETEEMKVVSYHLSRFVTNIMNEMSRTGTVFYQP